MATSKIQSYFDSALVDQAEKRAVDDEAFRTMLHSSVKAGAIIGAAIHGKDATAHVKALGDSVHPFAAAVLADPDNGEAVKEFKDLCGIVNAAIKSAQAAAKRAAISQSEAAKIADYSKKARDRIVKALDRHMAIYAVKVNWQAATVAACEEPTEMTDAEKAAAGVKRAFGLDGAAAGAALLSLDAATVAHLAAILSEQVKANRLRMLQDDEEHKLAAYDNLLRASKDPAVSVDASALATAKEQAEQAVAKLAEFRQAA